MLIISVSFAALLQTLKAEPEIVNLVYSISSTYDGEHHKDNNITKYLESNKDSLVDLAEKHYENLVEALTIMLYLVLPPLLPILHYHCRSCHLYLQICLIKMISTEKKSQKHFIIVKAILLNDTIISETTPPNSAISIKILTQFIPSS